VQDGIGVRAVPLGRAHDGATERVAGDHHPDLRVRAEPAADLRTQLVGEDRQRTAQRSLVPGHGALQPALREAAGRPHHHRQRASALLHEPGGPLVVLVEVVVHDERGAARHQDAHHLGVLVDRPDQLGPGAASVVRLGVDEQHLPALVEDLPEDPGPLRCRARDRVRDRLQVGLDPDVERHPGQRGGDGGDSDRRQRDRRDDLGARG
jgi:hypothetical protein